MALLLPVPDPTRRRNLGWTLPDYLLQHLTRRRAALVPPTAAWHALIAHASSPADLTRVADSAHNRGLGPIAERLYRAAVDADARRGLIRLLRVQGRAADAEQAWRDARLRLVEWLHQQGREADVEQVLRDAAAGYPEARRQLAGLLKQQGRAEESTLVEQCKLQPEELQPQI